MVTERNIYHPFLNTSLGFLIGSKSGKYSEDFLGNVNLHWQPVRDPTVGIPFLIIHLLIILAGGFVHYHLWQMLKRGDNLVSGILKAYVIVEMIFWPFVIIFSSVADFTAPLSDVFGPWSCVLSFFLIYPSVIFISFHTTVISIMRYIFIVHDETVASFGKQRAQKLFYWLLSTIPIVLTIWLYFGAVDRDFDGTPSINKCNGSYHKIFLIHWGFSERQDVWLARCGNTDNIEGLAYAKLFIQCGTSAILLVLLLLNVFDGFIYYRTWAHIIKTNRSSEKNLDKLLSENSKIRRRKLTEVNIKVTFVVWLTEFVGSILLIFGSTIFGHGQVGTGAVYIFAEVFYFVFLPFLYLVNNSDVKKTIAEDSWFRAVRGIFNRASIQELPK